MQPALAGAVGTPAQENHAHHRHGVGNGGDQTHVEIAFDAHVLDDRWQPERNAIQTDHEREVDEA